MSESSTLPTWWQWPTILSLDAPAVAFVWQSAIARAAGVRLSWPPALVLTSSVWLAYAADRWIEGWRLPQADVATERHRFYQRHRLIIAVVWISVLAADLLIAARELDARTWALGLVIVAAVAAYLLSHQLIHRHRAWRAPKEICVAGLLTAGVGAFVVLEPHSVSIAPSLVLFGGLCGSNCALISRWEANVDVQHGQTSIVLQFQCGAFVARLLPWLVGSLAIGCAITWPGAASNVALCAAASAAMLIVIDAGEPRAGRRAARVMADAALLTPLALAVWHLLT